MKSNINQFYQLFLIFSIKIKILLSQNGKYKKKIREIDLFQFDEFFLPWTFKKTWAFFFKNAHVKMETIP